jgi:hypothetical protein
MVEGGLPAIFPCLRSQAGRRLYRKRMAVLSRAVTGPLLRFIKNSFPHQASFLSAPSPFDPLTLFLTYFPTPLHSLLQLLVVAAAWIGSRWMYCGIAQLT